MQSQMRAIRMTRTSADSKPSVSVLTIPRPLPSAGNLLVKILASTINPSDLLNSVGNFDHTTYPRTLGRDFCGIVVDGPSDFVGQRVCGTSGSVLSFTEDGAQAEYCSLRQRDVAIVPSKLSDIQAAALGTPWSTASLIIERAQLGGSETALVLGGSGVVGAAVVQLLKSKGCKALIGGRGGSADINTSEDPTLQTAVCKTGGKGPDVVIDTVGDASLAKASLGVLAVGGKYLFISAAHMEGGNLEVNMKAIYRKQNSIIGCNSVEATQEASAGQLSEVARMMETGSLVPPSEEIFTKISLEEAAEVYHGKRSAKGAKYVVLPTTV